MKLPIYIFYIANIAIWFLSGAIEIITLLMFIRAILSWFPGIDRSSKIMRYLYMITEAVISPVRKFLDRFPSVRSFPIDLSFLVTYLILHFIQILLSSVSGMLT